MKLALAATLIALISAICLVLAACGGGGDDGRTDQPTPVVDCKAKPELCK